MARLTKRQLADIAEEKKAFQRVAALAEQQGYTLHRMIGLHPYGLLTRDRKRAVEGTLADIEGWLANTARS